MANVHPVAGVGPPQLPQLTLSNRSRDRLLLHTGESKIISAVVNL